MKPHKPVSAEVMKQVEEHNERAMALLIARAASAEATVEVEPAARGNPYAHGTTQSKLHGVHFNRPDE